MGKKIGRPPKPAHLKVATITVSLPKAVIVAIKEQSEEQAVPRSQVVLDALKAMTGEIVGELAQMRGLLREKEVALEKAEASLKELESALKESRTIHDTASGVAFPLGHLAPKGIEADRKRAAILRKLKGNVDPAPRLRGWVQDSANGAIPANAWVADVEKWFGSYGACLKALELEAVDEA